MAGCVRRAALAGLDHTLVAVVRIAGCGWRGETCRAVVRAAVWAGCLSVPTAVVFACSHSMQHTRLPCLCYCVQRDLEAAKTVWEALGFMLTPRGRHLQWPCVRRTRAAAGLPRVSLMYGDMSWRGTQLAVSPTCPPPCRAVPTHPHPAAPRTSGDATHVCHSPTGPCVAAAGPGTTASCSRRRTLSCSA